jgi:hypothetical protein
VAFPNPYDEEEEQHQDDEQWNVPLAFKPRKNYDLPPEPRDPNPKILPNEQAYKPPQENKSVQQMNDYLLQRVNDQNFQQKLNDNQYLN